MRIRFAVPAGVAALVACLLVNASTAFAQQFEKVESAAREQLPAPQFVGAAYGFIWLAILVYVAVVARNLAKTRGEIDELKSKVDRMAASDAAAR